MMMGASLGLGIGGLTAVALGVLIVPLWRARAGAAAPSRNAYDLGIYKAQLKDVDRDVERGVLDPEQAESLRAEIGRRLLRVAVDEPTDVVQTARPWRATAFIAAVVPVVSIGLYILLGAPSLPDQPFSKRADTVAQNQAQMQQIQSMVDQLSARLQANPKDGEGWAMMARSMRVMGKATEAEDAFERALPLLPKDTKVRLDYASLLLDQLPENEPLPPKFVGLMEAILDLDPNSPDALYFVGLAAAQDGHGTEAKAFWVKLKGLLPDGSPEQAEVGKMIENLPK